MTDEPDFRKKQRSAPVRVVLCIFLLFCLLYLLLSLLTFSVEDPSINHAVSGGKVSNLGGLIGAYIAGFCNDVFGTGSLVLPLLLTVFLIRCLTRKPPLDWWRWVGLGCLCFACLVFVQAADLSIGDLRGGGIAGRLILSASRTLLSPFGSTLFWLCLFVIGLQLFVSLPLGELAQRFRERFARDDAGEEDDEAGTGENVPRARRLLFNDDEEPKTVWGRIFRAAAAIVCGLAGLLISLFGRKKRNDGSGLAEPGQEAHGVFARTVAKGVPLVEENIPFARAEEAGVPMDRAYAEQYAAPERLAVYAPYQPHAVAVSDTEAVRPEEPATGKAADKKGRGPVGNLLDLLPSKVPSLEADADAKKASRQETSAETAEAAETAETETAGLAAQEAGLQEKAASADEKNECASEQDALRQALFGTDDEVSGERGQETVPESAPESAAKDEPGDPAASPEQDQDAGGHAFQGRESACAKQEASAKPAAVHTETGNIASLISEADVLLGSGSAAAADTGIHMAADSADSISEKAADDTADGFLGSDTAVPADSVLSQKPATSLRQELQQGLKPLVQTEAAPQSAAAPAERLPDNDEDDGADAVLAAQDTEYVLPPLALLQKPEPALEDTEEDIEQRSELLMRCLADFGIQAELVRATPGPVVTTYMLRPARGVSVRLFTRHTEDIARSLMAVSVFVQAPVPGTDTVGIVIPNCNRSVVNFREIAASPAFQQAGGALPIVVGKDTTGRPYVSDLARMPHLLVAGATGQGKSVCLNALLTSLLLTKTPQELKLLLVDPKRVEMGMYEDESHLVHPVVKEVSDAKNALLWAVAEMDQRYNRMARLYTKNIKGYNEKLASYKGSLPPELADLEPMPYIVIVIDELADLMLQARKDVEPCIIRLAQLARACGIHMIIATQRPSVDVVTGLIKANFPCRICFRVSSRQDSITTLGNAGAEKLLGNGDMFFNPNGGHLTRLHGPFLSDEEVQSVVAFWKKQCRPKYDVDFSTWGEEDIPSDTGTRGHGVSSQDAMYQEVLAFIREKGNVSISLLQRRFNIGYNKAARYMDQLDADGLVGPSPGAGKPRPVLMH